MSVIVRTGCHSNISYLTQLCRLAITENVLLIVQEVTSY